MQRRKLPPPRRKLAPPAPDRPPVKEMLVGPKRAFKPSLLAQFQRLLEKTPGNYWIIVYSGKGYTDLDLNTTKESTVSTIRHFKHCYPDAKVIYLKIPDEEPKASPKPAKRSFDKKKYAKAARARQY